MDILDGSGIGGMGRIGGLLERSRIEKEREKAEAAGKAGSADPAATEAKLRSVAEDFTSVFMNQVMKAMRASVEENPDMHGDNGETFFRDLLDTEYSKLAAKGSGYGITDLVYGALAAKARLHPAGGGAEDGTGE